MPRKGLFELRIWGSGVRISSGAPFSTHLRTRIGLIPAGQDHSFEHVLAGVDACAIAAAVALFNDLFDAECAGRAVAINIQLENKLDGFGIDGIAGQGLLDLGAALFDLGGDVAKRDGRTVPEALLGVGQRHRERSGCSYARQ